jgi:pilus assembly protein CpaF
MAFEQPGTSGAQQTAGPESLAVIDQETYLDIRSRVHERVLSECEAADLTRMSLDDKADQVRQALSFILKEGGSALPARLRDRLTDEVMDEIVGFGPIQPLLDDPTITEVMVNGPRKVYIERAGKIEATNRVFRDNGHVMRIIEKIVTPLGRRIDESQPMVDARLPDGSRVNAIIPPLAVTGPSLTIRKFSRIPFTVHDLISFGTMTEEMADFIRACVASRLNVLISGGTGSGKTTTLNVLSSFVPEDERIVTIEDAAELQLQQEHVVALESRPSNLEGKGEISIRQLVRNALRMRPDRIIVGEVRGGEALDMLQAMNTGHDGSLSTAHTNSPRDSIARLETMTLMAGTDLPSRAIREQIAAAMHLIVHQNRLRDGSRKITHITEVQGMEGDVIVLQDLFLFEQTGIDASGRVVGKHKATGLRPKFINRLHQEGVKLTSDIFKVA